MNSVVNGEIGPRPTWTASPSRGRRASASSSTWQPSGSKAGSTRRSASSTRAAGRSPRAATSFGADPFLDLTLPADGRYVVKVHDVIYAGSPDHLYRLTLPTAPTSTRSSRSIARAGGPDHVHPDRPQPRRLARARPAVSRAGHWNGRRSRSRRHRRSTSTRRPRRALPALVRPPRAGGSSTSSRDLRARPNPVFIAEAVDPIVLEREPNDAPSIPQEVTPPCDISGTFGAPNDPDIYRFRARKGEIWWIEADAERLGSPADPTFVVQKVVEQGAAAGPGDRARTCPIRGAELGSTPARSMPSLRWQVPEDGTYQVVVNDLYSSQRGDPRLVYRLNIRPERPDFRLFVVPAEPASSPTR